VLFRPNFMLASEEHPMKAHKKSRVLTMPSPPTSLVGLRTRAHTMVYGVQTPSQWPDMGQSPEMQAYNLLRKKYFHGVSSALHQKAEFSTVFDATSDSALKGSSALVCNFLLSYQQKQGISVETFGAESLFLVQKLLLVQSRVSSGNQHSSLLKSRYGKVRHIFCLLELQ